MRILQFSLCFLVTLPWISTVEGQLQCPSCTYLTTEADIPTVVRSIIEAILGIFQDEECSKDLTGPSTKIKEETCPAVEGQVPRCTFYKGSVTVTIPIPLLPDVDVPLKMYQRGCYHFKTANVPSVGCHRRENINEDKTIIKQLLDKVSSTFEDYNVAKFEGEMCLCTDTYCKETSGVSPSAKMNTLLLIFSAVFCSIVCYYNY